MVDFPPTIDPGLLDRYGTPRIFRSRFDDPFAGPPPEGFDSWADYWRFIDGRSVLPVFASPDSTVRGRKASMVFTRTGEDVATIGMHFLSEDSGVVVDFTDANSATIENLLVTMWGDLKPHFTGTIGLDRVVWHDFGINVRRPNPAVLDDSLGGAVLGTHIGTDPLPPQCATSVTFKTSKRRNWGRVYLPATVEANVTEGRFIESYVDDVRTAFGTLLDDAAAAHLPLVVWSPRHAGELLQYFKRDADHPESAHDLGLDNPDTSSFARSVDQVSVDDIVDTIRSRRYDVAAIHATHTLGG